MHGLPPEFAPTLSGLRSFAAATNGLGGLRFDTADLFGEEDRVVVRGTFRATHAAEVLGAPPTGRQVEWDMITIYRFSPEGHVAERWIQNDRAALFAQLGLTPG